MGKTGIFFLFFALITASFLVFNTGNAQQTFKITNFHCVSVSVSGNTASCQGQYTLTGTPPNSGYNVDLKLIKSYTYNGNHPDGTQIIIHSINPLVNKVNITVTGLPSPQSDNDIIYNVIVNVNDHIQQEYQAGAFSFTIPKNGGSTSTNTNPGSTSSGSISSLAGIGSTIARQFSGIVLEMKAPQIKALEKEGYVCLVSGKTILIKPKGKEGYQPTSYIIPAYVFSKNPNQLSAGKTIVGFFGPKIPTVCILPGVPPLIQIVLLDMVTLYTNNNVI